MRHDTEPITSLLIRETSIAASAAGKLSGALWQISRVLREHLQPDVKCDKMAINKGRSGAETARSPELAPLLPGLQEPEILSREYD